MSTTWKQVVLDTADAIREANGTSDKIPVGQIADKVRAGAGTPYEGDNPLTIGQAGFTFPAKTLLKEGLQIINGVSDKGQFVWKKGEHVHLDLTQITDSANPTILQVTSNDVDLSTVDALWFVGLTGTYTVNSTLYEIKVLSDTQILTAKTTVNYTYNPNTAQLSLEFAYGKSGRVWNGLDGSAGVEYVVSSDAGSYPDGAELNGYWYELIENPVDLADETDLIPSNIRNGVDIFGIIGTMSEGVSGIAFGTVTLSKATAPITVSHGLGVTPSWACIVPVTPYSPSDYLFPPLNINGQNYTVSSSRIAMMSATINKTSTQVQFHRGAYTSQTFSVGSYYWFAVV